MNHRPPVLVLGSGLTALGALRSLGRERIPAVLPIPQQPYVRASRWYRTPDFAPLDGDRDLAGYLRALPLERSALLPCSDAWVGRVARLPHDVRERFPASVPSAATVDVLVDKGRFAEHLAARGLPHPTTRSLEGRRELEALGGGGSPRLFLKPRRSQEFFRRFGTKGVMLEGGLSPAAAERFASSEFELLVQEYVPGPASNHYFVDGFVDRSGELRGMMVRRRLRMYPPDFGNSSYMVSVPPDRAAPAVDVVRRLLDGLDYRGIFSAEFKKDERDGCFRLLEVNARPWIFVEFAARCGVDVCTMAYRDAFGDEVPAVDGYQVGRTLVRPYYDLQACTALWRAGELSLVRALRSWVAADVPAFAPDDPAPALRSSAGFVAGFLRRRVPGARGKGKGPA